MSLTLDGVSVVGFFLALVRSSAWVILAPPFSSKTVPSLVKIGVAAALALVGGPRLLAGHVVVPTDTASLIGAVAVQVAVGLALGFLAQVLFSAVAAAGSMIELFGGLAMPASLDPLGENQGGTISQFYEMVAILLLIVSNGYLVVVNGFLRSFDAIGLSLPVKASTGTVIVSAVSTFFVAALEIAAPLIAVLFVVQGLLGLLSKAAPQMNIFSFMFPAQIAVTLLLVGVAARVLPTYVAHLVEHITGGSAALFG